MLLVLATVTGCSGEPAERYVPDTADARQSLEAALTSWKNGDPHQTVKTLDTPIDMVDSRWKSGQKLESFEIVEELPADPHRTFKVRMRIAGLTEAEEQETTYLVLGIDPILIFRSEEYGQPAGM
jgi:hypothetical protein